MKGFVVTKNNKIDNSAFTSLKAACKYAGVSYDSAARGKRYWVNKEDVITITEVEINKIENRGRK